MLIVAGPDVAARRARAHVDLRHRAHASVGDGRGVPRGVDGRVLVEAFDDGFASSHPVDRDEPVALAGATTASSGSGEVERRLKALGYT